MDSHTDEGIHIKQTSTSAFVFAGPLRGGFPQFPTPQSQGGLTDGFVGVESHLIDGAGVSWQLIQNSPARGVPHVHKPARYHEEQWLTSQS